MLTEQELSAAIGSTAYGVDGEKIGTVEHFFVDDRTGAPTWVAVTTGLFGTRHSVVPAGQAAFADGALRLPISRDAVRSAPQLGGAHLSPADETELRRHYGLDPGGAGVPAPGVPVPGAPVAGPTVDNPPAWPPPAPGPMPVGPGGDEAAAPPPPPAAATQQMPPVQPPVPPAPAVQERVPDHAMTRSEEQLRVGTERVAATRTRLVKYVITEEVQISVPIRREEIRVEEVPLDGDEAPSGESLVPAGQGEPVGGGLPDEIVLHAERPVVTVEVVPVERVRLRTEVVQGQEQVTEQVQRERIAVEETPPVRPR
jgi:uncharacterized protein (TIGR02271 family)